MARPPAGDRWSGASITCVATRSLPIRKTWPLTVPAIRPQLLFHASLVMRLCDVTALRSAKDRNCRGVTGGLGTGIPNPPLGRSAEGVVRSDIGGSHTANDLAHLNLLSSVLTHSDSASRKPMT